MISEYIRPLHMHDDFWQMLEMMFPAILRILWVISALRPLLLGMCWSPKRVQNLETRLIWHLDSSWDCCPYFTKLDCCPYLTKSKSKPASSAHYGCDGIHPTTSQYRNTHQCTLDLCWDVQEEIWHIKMLYMILYQSPLQHLQLRRYTKLRWALHCE